MTVTEFIDEIVGYSDNVNPAGADYADRRQRILFWLKREAAQVYYSREWPWALTETSPDVSIPASQGYGLLPADFLAITKWGHVYDMTQDGLELEPAPEPDVTDLLAMNHKVANSKIYAIFGIDSSNPPRKKIWRPYSDTAQTLKLFYHPTLPTLDESAGVNNLNRAIPQEFQETVLIPGVAARAKRSKSDARWKDDWAERADGLSKMIKKARRFQGGMQRLPSFFGH